MTRTRITVDDEAPGTPINPGMWGVFFEDINSAADGGLYAELIRNRDFCFSDRDHESWGPLTGWRPMGHVEIDPSGGRRAVRLRGAGVAAALENEGFGGIPLARGAAYRLTVRGRASATASITCALIAADGTTLASAPVDLSSSTAAEIDLRPDSTCPQGRLRLTVADGDAEFTWVSLFPRDTYRGDENGLRPDLAHAIAELRPRFVRFPGGCVAHGFGLENVYRWKNTVGSVTERVGDRNIWGYHQSMGLGFFEYFRFCEQLGAAPLPVVAAGVCCQNSPGGQAAFTDEQMSAYIRDVLDLIDFANGPESSPWGAVRSAAGHPQPFGLRYLGIGNEDEITDAFAERFAQLLRAVRHADPSIIIVGTAGPFPAGVDYERGWELARRVGVDIVDEHSYKAPKWYFQNLDRFDAYDRGGPRVYVGEYGSRGNTMLCALSEAAYMMGMERNGDIVRLASYAPLLAKIGETQWTPDLIYFDNERVLRSLNYHVQRMHAAAPASRALPTRVSDAPSWARRRSDAVAMEVRAQTGTISVESCIIDADGTQRRSEPQRGEGSVRPPLDTRASDYTIRARVCLEADGRDGFLIAFGDVDGPDHFEWRFGTWENRFLVLCEVTDGISDEWSDPLPFPFTPARSYDVEIRVRNGGRRVSALLDGLLVHDLAATDAPEVRFSATSTVDDDTGHRWIKIVNATESTVDTDLRLASGETVRQMEITELSAPAASGRPFEAARTEPRTFVLDGARYLIPGHAFAVIRLNP
ncbi:alpha-L-arabinofuranosidase C-terminal domain-containing protein [uncultured Microbacterium sp.]|uniref:alpha-L-arabinofuranosidase C-terminal domain-containing protein n=1 Tax=uncultured Microbacterium sp. TaxID=191216 RepID=UPI0025EE34DF|nr:alpha-L-arabinofuranosidase C-terminal domain-containing protein [uncultured Microbacterium sp.]